MAGSEAQHEAADRDRATCLWRELLHAPAMVGSWERRPQPGGSQKRVLWDLTMWELILVIEFFLGRAEEPSSPVYAAPRLPAGCWAEFGALGSDPVGQCVMGQCAS